MKWHVCFVVLIISLANAEKYGEKGGVLRRATRQAMGGMGDAFLKQTETNLILNCKKNGLSNSGADKLQQTYDALKECMRSTLIFSVPKSEFITKMETCSRDAIYETRECLAADQKYFPELLLTLSKSMVTFIYDNKSVMGSSEVISCFNNFARRTVQTSYITCLIRISNQTHDDENIPNSKAEFCRKFLPAAECFPKTLDQFCIQSITTKKFFNDYTQAVEQPCESKEI